MPVKFNWPPKGAVSLCGLLTRVKASFFVALAGAWGLIMPRVNFLEIKQWLPSAGLFYLDLVSLFFLIMGVFAAVFYCRRLKPRLARLDFLGESGWK